MKTAIIAALPGEVAPLLRRGGFDAHPVANRVYMHERGDLIIAYAGIGAARVTLACEAVSNAAEVERFVSVGWAGALDPGIAAGAIVRPAEVVDEADRERFPCAGEYAPRVLLTVNRVLDKRAKINAAVTFYADLVDMEAVHVARFANRVGAEFRCIKAVSDGFQDELPDLNRFTSKDGQFMTGKFVAWAALRPWWWSAVARMGAHSERSAQRLCDTLAAEFLR